MYVWTTTSFVVLKIPSINDGVISGRAFTGHAHDNAFSLTACWYVCIYHFIQWLSFCSYEYVCFFAHQKNTSNVFIPWKCLSLFMFSHLFRSVRNKKPEPCHSAIPVFRIFIGEAVFTRMSKPLFYYNRRNFFMACILIRIELPPLSRSDERTWSGDSYEQCMLVPTCSKQRLHFYQMFHSYF